MEDRSPRPLRYGHLVLVALLAATAVQCGPAQDPPSQAAGASPSGRAERAPAHRNARGPARRLSQSVHEAWREEDGLPYAGATALEQTPDGYLWVGTKGGLARFDGARFVAFTTATTAALRSNSVSALWVAQDGTLWIGTLGGLTRLRDGRFTTYTTADGLPSDNVWAVTGEPDGTLWIGTLGGLTRLRDGRFTTYTTADGLPSDDVRALSVAPDGALWVAAYGGGVLRWADGRAEAYRLTGLPAGPLLRAVLAGPDGTVWAGVGEGQVDRSPHQLLRLGAEGFHPAAPERALSAVRALHQDSDGGLWVGTYGDGLARYAGGAVETFSAVDGLTDDRVQAVFEDRDGNVWAGTAGGLDLLRRDAPFVTYGQEEGLPDGNVRAVTEDARGAVWVATAGGAARFDDAGVTAFTPREGLAEPYVHSLGARRNGEVWLGGLHSVTRYADGRFTRFGLPDGWPRGAIWSIVEDSERQLWLGSAGGGLVRFDPAAPRLYTVVDGLAHNSVTALLPARSGGLWVGTAGGLNRMTDGQIRPAEGAEGLRDVNVRSLYEDGDGALWVGTYGRGLARLREGRLTVYTVREGLHDDGVWSVLDDGRGRLWMSSDRGVFRVSKRSLDAVADGHRRTVVSVAFGVADGMRSAEGNGAGKPAGWRSRDGRMWFATQRGVAVVNPLAAGGGGRAPVVEAVRTRAGAVDVALGDTLSLPAVDRDLTVAYTCLDFANPQGLRFRYRLDGFTNGWVEAEGRREAVFTNVPAGHYAFRVAAADGGGAWREGDRALAVTVAPFVWETAWFRLLAVLALAGLAGLAAQAKGRRQGRRAEALEAEVAARTAELRDAKETTEAQAVRLLELDLTKSRFFANVSHEFRTPLTLTLGPLDDVLAGDYGPVPDDAAGALGLARRSAGRVLDLINQLLDLSRLEAGSTPLRARRLDLGVFARAQTDAFATLAAHRRIDVAVSLPEAPVEVWADPEHVGTVLANVLSNAFKFTPEGGRVAVFVEADGHEARVAVADTGPGIAPEDLGRVFDRFYHVDRAGQGGGPLGSGIGLALAHDLAALHGGALTAASDVGSGSTFMLALPLGRAHLAPDQIHDGPWDGAVATAGSVPVAPPAFTTDDDADDLDADDVTTVLVADDNADIRAYVRRHLEAAGYRVAEAADGADALASVRARLPDLVVSDVMMPRLDGLGLCRALRSDPETDFVPVLLLTAKAAPEDRLGGLAEHCDDYLTKPFDVRELVARVDNLIGLRRRLRERFSGAAEATGAGVPGDGAAAEVADVEALPIESADDAFAAAVRAAIEARLGDETFGVAALAEAVGQSRSQLLRRTTALLKTSPSEMLRAARLDRAGRLLEARAGTVSEVAYAVGFKSVAHFSNAFLAHTGARPSAYAEAER